MIPVLEAAERNIKNAVENKIVFLILNRRRARICVPCGGSFL